MSTANKLTYLNGTKQAIKQAINEDFEVIDNNTTFREYAEEISSNNAKYKDLIPKETKNATNTLDISNSSGLDKALVTQYGNTYQEGEPTPDAPKEIQVVSGDNTIIVSNSDNTQSQSYPINLGDIELCKIGDYKDRIYPLNGKWYLEKKIGKVVLDGSENWGISSGNFYMTSITNYKRSENKPYSNYYQGTLNTSSASRITNGQIAFNTAIEFNRFYLSNTSISSVNDIKNWLNTHNTEVYYVLATPTTTEITENNYPTLYNQLNNIKLYEGVNHITMTNESGLDVEFDITYYKDWKLD